jgi:hypothetical protein
MELVHIRICHLIWKRKPAVDPEIGRLYWVLWEAKVITRALVQ